jgi:hypothetical protein
MTELEFNFILGVLTGIMLSFLVVYLLIRRIAKQVMGELDKDITKIKEAFMPVTIEKVDDQLFCYSKKDNQFICQGANMEEVRSKFRERFPEKTAFLTGGSDEELLDDIKNQLKELNEAGPSK